jgi:hypothetical protein
MLTLLSGFALMSDDSADPSFDTAVFEGILIGLFATCFALEMGIMIIVDWGLGEFVVSKCGSGTVEKVLPSTKVTPEMKNSVTNWDNSDAKERSEKLRNVRKDFGAGSQEYLDAINEPQGEP